MAIAKVLTSTGFFLNILGVFLPWGQEAWPAGVMGRSFKIGIELPLGIITLLGSIILALSLLLFEHKEWKSIIYFVIISGAMSTISPFLWIIWPGVLSFSTVSYKVAYGVYISFSGGCFELVGIIVRLRARTIISKF